MPATDDAAPKLPAAFDAPPHSGPVQCLGLTFESDEARREHFLARLKEKLPELRQRPDFPVAEDQDILRLSDPPYYTACPNPFLAEFVEHHGRPYDADEPYHREPFAVDVSAGKYRAYTQRRLKLFRLEAVRAGFRRAWQTKDYGTIVEVARKIPDDVLHEDPKSLMWYDQASTRAARIETPE